MKLTRRRFVTAGLGVLGATAITGATTADSVLKGTSDHSGAFLHDMSLMLRSRIPVENVIAMLAQKYERDSKLSVLCLDLLRGFPARTDAERSAHLDRVFTKHRNCFSNEQYARVAKCIRSGNLDRIV